MNTITLAEQVHRILAGGTPASDNDIAIQEVILKVKQNHDLILLNYLWEQNKGMRRVYFKIPNNCLKEETLSVTDDTAILPFTPMSLPEGKGIYEVVQTGDCEGTSAIHPMRARRSIYQGLESESLEGSYGYSWTGKTLKFVNSDGALEEVIVTYVPSAMDYDEDTEWSIPASLHPLIIEKTVRDFAPHLQAPQDNKNDNKDQYYGSNQKA